MHSYRLVIDLGPKGPAQSITINLGSREEALIVAQRYNRPAQLWDGDGKVCSIKEGPSGVWIISD